MTKILSIIVPTYNMEKYVGNCIESMSAIANKSRLEIIAVNDGSTDTSLNILKQYAQTYPDVVKVIDKTNGNYGSCINAALPIAVGKYIKVLDADDWVDSDEFAKYITHLEQCDADVSVTSFKQVYENGIITNWPIAENEPIGVESVMTFFSYKENITLPMHRLAYKTELLRNINYRQTEGISYTDSEWVYIPMLHVKTVDISKYNVYQYRLGRAGQTMDPKVILRSMSHELILMQSMLSHRTKELQNLSGTLLQFANFAICRKALVIYTQMLIKANDKQFQRNIINDLETTMQTYAPELYEKMATYDARCCVIRHWRATHKRYNIIVRKGLEYAISLYKMIQKCA